MNISPFDVAPMVAHEPPRDFLPKIPLHKTLWHAGGTGEKGGELSRPSTSPSTLHKMSLRFLLKQDLVLHLLDIVQLHQSGNQQHCLLGGHRRRHHVRRPGVQLAEVSAFLSFIVLRGIFLFFFFI